MDPRNNPTNRVLCDDDPDTALIDPAILAAEHMRMEEEREALAATQGNGGVALNDQEDDSLFVSEGSGAGIGDPDTDNQSSIPAPTSVPTTAGPAAVVPPAASPAAAAALAPAPAPAAADPQTQILAIDYLRGHTSLPQVYLTALSNQTHLARIEANQPSLLTAPKRRNLVPIAEQVNGHCALDRLTSNTNTKLGQALVALLLQVAGVEAQRPCRASCHTIFVDCIVGVSGAMRSETDFACANHWYNGSATRCYFYRPGAA